MAAYIIVSATGNVGAGRRTWNEGGWDTLAWRDVGDNSVLKATRRLVASTGAFTRTGIAATTRRGYPLIASTGVRTVTGIAAGTKATRRMVASAGAITITRNPAGTNKGFKVFGSAGSFAVIGIANNFRRGLVVIASTGARTLGLIAANLVYKRIFPSTNRAFVITRFDAILKKGFYISGAKGTYGYGGNGANTLRGYKVIASTGAIVITGNSAGLLRYARLAADCGIRTITGQVAITKKGFFIAASTGSRIITGIPNALWYGRAVKSDTGVFLLSGKVAITKKGFDVLASRGVYSVLGRVASLYRKLFADKGSIFLTGNNADLRAQRRIAADGRNFTVTGVSNNFSRVRRLVALTGSYELRYSFTYLRYAGYGFLRPDGNVTQTNFTGGFAEIDEIAAVDSDFAWSANNVAAVLQVTLSNPAFLPINGAVVVRFRIARTNNGVIDGTGNAVTVTPSFYQGAALLATGAARTATGTWTEYSFSFDASLVTDWTNVQLRFDNSASGGTGTTRRGAAISWARVELPLVASPDSFGIYGESVSFEFGNTPYIIASKGSIQIFGQDANFLRYLVVIANSRAFAVSTGQAVLARSRQFTASAGSFAVTGVANNFRRGIVMPAATGSANVTGNAATTARSRILTASAGARSVTGVAAILKKGFKIFAANGSYSIVNGNALFQRGIRLVASNLSLFVSGQAATTRKGFKLVSSTGAYAIFGNTAIFLKTYVFAASKGTFTVVGNVAESQGQYALTGSGGSVFILDGQAAFLRSYVATAVSRVFSVFGPVQSLAHGRKLLTLANSYTVIGKNVNFQKGYTVIAHADIFSIASSDTKWIRTYIFGTVKSQVSVAGNTSILSAGYDFPVVNVAVLVTGVDARLRYKRRRQKMLLIL